MALVLTATLLPASPASAAPGPVAPVVPIVAPVVDIVFSDADLRRTARVDGGPSRTTITLDSTVLFAKDSRRSTARPAAGWTTSPSASSGRDPAA